MGKSKTLARAGTLTGIRKALQKRCHWPLIIKQEDGTINCYFLREGGKRELIRHWYVSEYITNGAPEYVATDVG